MGAKAMAAKDGSAGSRLEGHSGLTATVSADADVVSVVVAIFALAARFAPVAACFATTGVVFVALLYEERLFKDAEGPFFAAASTWRHES